ncbi:tyrosine--tRNA ligase [Candidatus Kaiserbacteria bacterium RIFCSPHIGHO2_01_FULL_50_13]|uniref:Tyrosine--tRNA ligase n=1 Tax=Candidatus Kaiserbacteria bacterium RIFCSPLOWO2_01_FULL_50_24 TaxID=1798507 RepID=A0A1F6EMP9_9BACT|nr:MAG: tyrosine--tRNA ligase [Candidatus Kaiserbacteria bacterium RIFCSPHIGHO2_01_FULL_50_13]OGG74905.1 MAG: tyrosine--tRNA ligase [Candidatus Kaiserbacteria bacterium RIFCSPLOWO2_01_FULL_50_24]OGG82103.1 MAG: tyrosine--tRNA ligase [Candidatus Kaiserbacteria bacterium RIFCSPLOWO2_02_FULL_51_13]
MGKLSEVLKERGYVYQHSSERLEEITDVEKRTVYEGFDPSADSLHVGNLMGMLVLRRILEAGHNVILLVGGGTGMIGDPSGKSEERVLLDADTIAANAAAIAEQAKNLFSSNNFRVVDNADWLKSVNLIEFLRDVGKHVSVNAMMQRDAVRERLEHREQGISYTEFSYMLLQAYDFLHLHKEYGCDWQHGSSDQWGNIVSGIDLIRREAGAVVYGTTHGLLINKATGKKFGKTEEGTVWLNPKKTSIFDFYQFWLNTEDETVKEYLLKMTMLGAPEIGAAMELHARDPKERHAQKLLAREVTALVHGVDEAEKSEVVSQVLFGDVPLVSLSEDALTRLRETAPTHEVKDGALVINVLIDSKLASSKREAREFIAKNAVELNGVPITDLERALVGEDFHQGCALLKRGKRSVCVLVRV